MGKRQSKLDPQTTRELLRNTKFDEKELKSWYKGFLKDCPSGYLTKDQFIDMYKKVFQQGDASKLAACIFRRFDVNHDGKIGRFADKAWFRLSPLWPHDLNINSRLLNVERERLWGFVRGVGAALYWNGTWYVIFSGIFKMEGWWRPDEKNVKILVYIWADFPASVQGFPRTEQYRENCKSAEMKHTRTLWKSRGFFLPHKLRISSTISVLVSEKQLLQKNCVSTVTRQATWIFNSCDDLVLWRPSRRYWSSNSKRSIWNRIRLSLAKAGLVNTCWSGYCSWIQTEESATYSMTWHLQHLKFKLNRNKENKWSYLERQEETRTWIQCQRTWICSWRVRLESFWYGPTICSRSISWKCKCSPIDSGHDKKASIKSFDVLRGRNLSPLLWNKTRMLCHLRGVRIRRNNAPSGNAKRRAQAGVSSSFFVWPFKTLEDPNNTKLLCSHEIPADCKNGNSERIELTLPRAMSRFASLFCVASPRMRKFYICILPTRRGGFAPPRGMEKHLACRAREHSTCPDYGSRQSPHEGLHFAVTFGFGFSLHEMRQIFRFFFIYAASGNSVQIRQLSADATRWILIVATTIGNFFFWWSARVGRSVIIPDFCFIVSSCPNCWIHCEITHMRIININFRALANEFHWIALGVEQPRPRHL